MNAVVAMAVDVERMERDRITGLNESTNNDTDRWRVIALTAGYMHAVCRIPEAGTAVLVSRQGNRGVLLTTSAVLSSRSDAASKQAVFFETPTLGAARHSGIPRHPITVKLRPDKLFFTSIAPSPTGGGGGASGSSSAGGSNATAAEAAAAAASALGYAICGCDLVSIKGDGNLDGVVPIPLPILVSHIPDINVNDTHLFVSYPDGLATRRYYVTDVVGTFESHCVHATIDLSSTMASGGPVFNSDGEFIGIQHMAASTASYCVYARDIVLHLMESLVLGQCSILLQTSDPEFVADRREHDGTKHGYMDVTKQQQEGPFKSFEGAVLADHSYVALTERQRQAKPRATLVVPTHMDVWEEFYRPQDYRSLVLLLHAFPAHTKLLTMILEKITAPEHRRDMPGFARLGGTGILLEALDAHPYDEAIMIAGVSCVARLSLYPDNRESIGKYSGVTTLLSLMKEYQHTPKVQEWGCYALMNLCHDTMRQQENRQQFVSRGGVARVTQALKANNALGSAPTSSSHLSRWASQLLGFVVEGDKVHFDAVIEAGTLGAIFDAIKVSHGRKDGYALCGEVECVVAMTALELFDAATHFFSRIGLCPLLIDVLRCFAEVDTEARLVEATLHALVNVVRLERPFAAQCVEHDVQDAMCRCALTFFSNAQVHEHVADMLLLTGVTDLTAACPHLQVQVAQAKSKATGDNS